jgi:hypothetical protein
MHGPASDLPAHEAEVEQSTRGALIAAKKAFYRSFLYLRSECGRSFLYLRFESGGNLRNCHHRNIEVAL